VPTIRGKKIEVIEEYKSKEIIGLEKYIVKRSKGIKKEREGNKEKKLFKGKEK